MSDNTADRIVHLFDAEVSQKEIARLLKISYQTVRKNLCTAGRIETREMRMQADGMTPEEIAKALDKTIKTVNSRLPYTKGQYKGDNPSINALRVRACRERKKEGRKHHDHQLHNPPAGPRQRRNRRCRHRQLAPALWILLRRIL